MGRKANLSTAEWVAVGTALGMSALGISLILIAAFDPEPTSKLAILLAGGVFLIGTGGLTAIKILAKTTPPNIEVSGPDGRAWILKFS